jgi:D-3-phosphoglycerate dehydrogenase
VVRLIGGALFLRNQPRIVLLDEYRLDALPVGRVLVMTNRDVPGVIGRVGTILGEGRINIAEWRMARNAPGDVAVSFINIDSPVGDEVMAQLRGLPQVLGVRQVSL